MYTYPLVPLFPLLLCPGLIAVFSRFFLCYHSKYLKQTHHTTVVVESSLHLPDGHILENDSLLSACFQSAQSQRLNLWSCPSKHIHRLLKIKGEGSGSCHQCRPWLASSVALRILNIPQTWGQWYHCPPVRGTALVFSIHGLGLSRRIFPNSHLSLRIQPFYDSDQKEG